MGEERFEMKPYGVRYKCNCGGEMIPTGKMLMSNPPQFPHECKECREVVNLKEKFPTVRWETMS
jgi:hypothetical protein